MSSNNLLDSFYKLFVKFETLDGTDNLDPSNTNFNLYEWIDLLRDNLFKDDFAFASANLERAKDTPYIEFIYSFKYFKNKMVEVRDYLRFSSQVNATQSMYYELQNLFTFIYSQLNRLTMLHYIYVNEDYLFDEVIKATSQNEKTVGAVVKDKLKRVTFNNWRYNPLIHEYEKSILWNKYLKDTRNSIEHYGVLFNIGDLNEFENVTFNFYIEIMLVEYLFLFYVQTYLDEFYNEEKIEG